MRTKHNAFISQALTALANLDGGEGLDCALMSNLVGYVLESQGFQVEVVEGHTWDMPIHYWLEVDGELVDPMAVFCGGYAEAEYVEEDRFPVYGPDKYIESDFCTRIWGLYLKAAGWK